MYMSQARCDISPVRHSILDLTVPHPVCVVFAHQAEDASRALDEQLGLIRGRVSQLEGALKGRDKEVDRLQRALEAVRTSEYDITGKQLATEEEARCGSKRYLRVSASAVK
jgi:hypothetical protein